MNLPIIPRHSELRITFRKRWIARLLAGAMLVSCVSPAVLGQVLLDENWADGSRTETKRPKEAAVFVGRPADVTVKEGTLSTVLTPTSQKVWTYFTDKAPATLKVGQKLKASVSFIPRGKLSESTSRSFRLGVFHDATSPRVEKDMNDDSGGANASWTDAKGYAVQALVAGGEYASAKPFDLGKRVNLESKSLLGTSGDYSKVSGGEPVALSPEKEYTITLEIDRVSDTQNDVTASYYQDKKQLSTWTVTDDGDYLGTDPPNDKFDLLYIRLANDATIAEKIDFTNFKVEVTPIDSKQSAAK
jgi:hypothetical protein